MQVPSIISVIVFGVMSYLEENDDGAVKPNDAKDATDATDAPNAAGGSQVSWTV